MIVVGGTYRERCAVPSRDTLRGSGLRAAAAIRQVTDVSLLTAVDEATDDEARTVLGGLGLEADIRTRTGPVSFEYFTPVTAPAINGRMVSCEPLDVVNGETVLAFGMVESSHPPLAVSAECLVFDPQQPRDLTQPNWSKLQASRLAVVANRAETSVLGASEHVETAARQLLMASNAEVVVTKLGALGALVTTARDQRYVGPHPTLRVDPLGSGDVFAAAFSFAWGEQRRSALESTQFASKAASEAVSRQIDDFAIAGDGAGHEPVGAGHEFAYEGRAPTVYLAGPFFTLPQRWLIEMLRTVLGDLGARVFSPLHDVGKGDHKVAEKDLAGLRESDSVLAVLDGNDAGTLFECGYATARDIPVVGYAQPSDPEGGKMLEGTGAELCGDLSTAVYRSVWRAMGA